MVARSRNASLVLQRQVFKTADYTVVTTTDGGKIFASVLDGISYALPAIAIGNTFTFLNLAKDGAALINIVVNTGDGITWAGAEDDNKDLLNTKATQRKGDYATVSSFTATGTWQIPAIRGIWAKET